MDQAIKRRKEILKQQFEANAFRRSNADRKAGYTILEAQKARIK